MVEMVEIEMYEVGPGTGMLGGKSHFNQEEGHPYRHSWVTLLGSITLSSSRTHAQIFQYFSFISAASPKNPESQVQRTDSQSDKKSAKIDSQIELDKVGAATRLLDGKSHFIQERHPTGIHGLLYWGLSHSLVHGHMHRNLNIFLISAASPKNPESQVQRTNSQSDKTSAKIDSQIELDKVGAATGSLEGKSHFIQEEMHPYRHSWVTLQGSITLSCSQTHAQIFRRSCCKDFTSCTSST